MRKKLHFKSTVTTKRQITIPKEICDILDIKIGDEVVFYLDNNNNNRIIFNKNNPKTTCFACKGTGKLGMLDCFVCYGTGLLATEINDNVLQIIGQIALKSLIYKVSIKIENCSTTAIKDNISPIPSVKLNSNEYSFPLLMKVQDEIQKKLILHFTPRQSNNPNLLQVPNDKLLKEILKTLCNADSITEVKSWFRPEIDLKGADLYEVK
ncbi:MAG: AbrB/MazE/SpoVT family DNA-binding domain-containing protein [Bacillota bacterium]